MIINKTELPLEIRQFRNRLGTANLAKRSRLGRLRGLTPERFKALPENERTERQLEIERLAGSLKTYQKNPVVSRAPQFQAALQNVELLRQITAPTKPLTSPPGRLTFKETEQLLPGTDHAATTDRQIIISALLPDKQAIPGGQVSPLDRLIERFKAENRTIKNERTTAAQKHSADTFLAGIKNSLKFSIETLLRNRTKEGR
ncbi:MAG: hypothetical protein WCW67_03960 [Candidatus Margulisiibacteriota bacterium]